MIYIMSFFSIVAGIDKLLNNRFGIGEKFDEGFKSLGGLALTIIGLYSISPVIAELIKPVIYPISDLLHIDPSFFISSILAPDLGGYNASVEIAKSIEIGVYNGVILTSMLGTAISFIIPVAIGIISKEDFDLFAKGALSGIMTIPIGMLVGGLMMKLKLTHILNSVIPVIVFSIFMSIGLIKKQKSMIKLFNILGKIIITISTIGLIFLIIKLGFNLDIVEGMISLEEAALLIVQIAIVLSGAFPMFHVLSKLMHKQIRQLEDRFKLDQYSVLGMLSTMVHCMPMLEIYNKMNDKGKILNGAFVMGAGFTIGGQFGYISSVAPKHVNAYIVSKIVAGITAVFLANLFIKLEGKKVLTDNIDPN